MILIIVERKVLSFLQRRVGPNVLDYRGRLQFAVVMLERFSDKGFFMPNEADNLWRASLPSIFLALCYIFCLNFVWGFSVSILDVEYNIAYILILSILLSFGIILIGSLSKNKYCLIAAIGCSILVITLDAVMGIFSLNIIVISGAFYLTEFCMYQKYPPILLTLLGAFCLITLIFLLEMYQVLFDLTEDDLGLIVHVSFCLWVTTVIGSAIAIWSVNF
jgi:NADH-quinone oxidoreductase subunit H